MSDDGYSINMRQDARTGEYLAVLPSAYHGKSGRYYLALVELGGNWEELTPEYLTRYTRTVSEFPKWLKRRADRMQGYILNLAPRLYG